MKGEPYLAWPGWAHLRDAGWLSLANALWFVFVYGGADLLTARRDFRVSVHVPAELRIPLVPSMTIIYMSLYILFFVAPFILRTRRELRALIGAMALAILASGVAFLLFPAELAFAPAREERLGVWAGLYRIADGLNLTYNLLPSLHVTFAVLCGSALARRAPQTIKTLLWLWAFLIAVSTVLIHQHHVLDVVAGWLLATLLSRSWGRATSATRYSGTTAVPP